MTKEKSELLAATAKHGFAYRPKRSEGKNGGEGKTKGGEVETALCAGQDAIGEVFEQE